MAARVEEEEILTSLLTTGLARGVRGSEPSEDAKGRLVELLRLPAPGVPHGVRGLPEIDVHVDSHVEELGARGVQLFTNVAGKPLNAPEILPLFDLMAGYDLPILLSSRERS